MSRWCARLTALMKSIGTGEDDPGPASRRVTQRHTRACSLPILAEIGDDRTRFTTAGGRKACVGSSPDHPGSGKRKYVGRRFVKNNRLNHVGYLWAFATLTHSKGVNAHHR